MSGFLERLGVELPVVQAGMGGGIARHELAAEVSEAGGLGTLGILPPPQLEAELDAARRVTGKPIAVNLLFPFATDEHRRVAAKSDAVVTFWGKPRRPCNGVWIHQCGSVEEILAAREAGADAVIAQGVEAGGHVRGSVPALEFLERVRRAVPADYPVLLAGGIADAKDLRRALDAGATAGVLGTAFVLSEESRAHPDYKRRLIDANSTRLTELYGLGWPAAPHRVVPNASTLRWTKRNPRGPGWARGINRAVSPLASRMPAGLQARMLSRQGSRLPLLSPQPPTDDGPEGLLESGPLYAGETVLRLDEIRPAAEIVKAVGSPADVTAEGNRP